MQWSGRTPQTCRDFAGSARCWPCGSPRLRRQSARRAGLAERRLAPAVSHLGGDGPPHAGEAPAPVNPWVAAVLAWMCRDRLETGTRRDPGMVCGPSHPVYWGICAWSAAGYRAPASDLRRLPKWLDRDEINVFMADLLTHRDRPTVIVSDRLGDSRSDIDCTPLDVNGRSGLPTWTVSAA
jgi:hypothetical protein